MESQLSSQHQKTYDRVLQQPMLHSLQWRDVWAMLGILPGADAVQDDRGNLKVSRNGQTLTLRRPSGKDLANAKELMRVRHFLERSGTMAPAPAAAGTHLLVVIDHRQARIYRTEMHGSTPQRIEPYDPFGFGRDLHHNRDDLSGQRKRERNDFYEAVAKTLRGAQQILLFGAGTGASSAMEHLLGELKHRHGDLARRVVGSIVVDEHHLTEDQLLAKARTLFLTA